MEAGTVTPTQQAAPPPRLREKYENEVLPALTKKFGYTTPMEAPHLLKITLNMGLGKEKQDNRSFELAHEQLAIIAGQHPNVRRARKSIAVLQSPRGHAGRRLGDAAPRPHVGVPRSPHLDRGAAHP